MCKAARLELQAVSIVSVDDEISRCAGIDKALKTRTARATKFEVIVDPAGNKGTIPARDEVGVNVLRAVGFLQ
jgi:hypothetical protein